jgi:hypothetical protein
LAPMDRDYPEKDDYRAACARAGLAAS